MLKLPNPHPGEFLKSFFLDNSGMSQNELAESTGLGRGRISEVIRGRRGISAETAIRLADALGTSERFWMGLQADFDLELARERLAAR